MGEDGNLGIETTHDASNTLRENKGTPLLTVDMWEHSYYIDFRNDRGSYLEAVWNLINWEFASANFETASSSESK